MRWNSLDSVFLVGSKLLMDSVPKGLRAMTGIRNKNNYPLFSAIEMRLFEVCAYTF